MQVESELQSNGNRGPVVIVGLATLVLAAVIGTQVSISAFILLVLTGGGFLALRRLMGMELLVAVAFLVPVEVAVSSFVTLNAVVLVLPILVLFWLLGMVLRRDLRFLRSHTYAPIILLTTLALVSWIHGNAIWNPIFPRPSNLLFVQFGQWAIFALSAVAYIYSAHQSAKALRSATFLFLMFGTLAMIARYGGSVGSNLNYVLQTNAQSNGAFFVWFTALAIGQSLFNRGLGTKWRIAFLILAVSVPVMGFWQNTDWASSWMPPLIVLVFSVWLRYQFRGVLLIVFLLAAGVLLFASVGVYYDWVTEREISVGGRFALWASVIELSLDSPLLGIGLTTYRQYHRVIPLLTNYGIWYQPNINSHNLYIDLFSQLGVIGVLAFTWFVFEVARLAWKLRSRFSGDFGSGYVNGVLAGLLGMLITSAIAEWLMPFVYNIGFRGFRFSIFSWCFLGGLIILERCSNVQIDLVCPPGNSAATHMGDAETY